MFSFFKEIDLGFKIPTPSTTIKVAITGLSQSGKSVFITSLINQLLANDKLPYLNEKLNRPFKATLLAPDQNSPYRRFEYYKNLESFKKDPPSWPKPTREVTKSTLKLEIKSEYALLDNQIIYIELIDYPGEWLLDLSMLELDFRTWSDMTLDLAHSSVRKRFAQKFFSYVESAELYKKSYDKRTEELICDSYKEYLKSLYYNHMFFIQPGRFLEPGDLAGDPMLNFAPLPHPDSGVVVEDGSIYDKFRKNYELYLKEVVNKLYINHFREFDSQIILVDLIRTLEHGKDSFDDMRLAFKHILKSFTYGKNSFLSNLFTTKIDHVIFAASKADYIPRSQHNAYKDVLVKLIKNIKNELEVENTKSEVTILSSVKATDYINVKQDGEVLECIKGVVEGESEPSIFYPGRIPANIDSKEFWENHDFEFPKFLPKKFHLDEDEALEHIRMDRLIYSLIEDHV